MELLWAGPEDGATLLLAHSAGSGMGSRWMDDMCGLLGDRGIRTVRFEFVYMAARRTGARPPTPRADRVLGEFREAWDAAGRPAHIGGKSYGGRVASMLADELGVAGLICLGYPFHPPQKPAQLRTAHLLGMTVPALICQGTRDPFGTREEVPGYGLPPSIGVHWLEDGDHDLRPRKAASGRTFAQNLAEAADAAAAFTAHSTI